MIYWEQPSPMLAAQAHAKERAGLVWYNVLPTGSMEPFLTGGDYIVADSTVPWEKLQPGDLVVYQASWLPATSPVVCHMIAAKSGSGWVMDGIANRHYENGRQTMYRESYRAKVIAVYTKRQKP
jgi:signal peptidase I